ncbi:MAG: TetR family transcriptional regulator [Micavibrio aeruginosavorus]|uniref:TetR family transcriptional regulator n=1 Tax=Micavibrio aeruginosavorus TaxID=349221 RepID=A0A7T5R409_9BACT|nr:MAG: TetR family transcriptional regulator [Micavibrio aeruginosavorus]
MATRKPQKSKENPKERIVNAALALTARDGWEALTMEKIARQAKISLATLREFFDDRYDILACYARMVDQKVLDAVGETDKDASRRDRLFDILMERFDILNENREALVSVIEDIKCEPHQIVTNLPYLARSMGWMLEAAGIETAGLRGAAHIAALSAVYIATIKTWTNDDSLDLSKTMAALDRNLGHAEKCAGILGLI